MKQPVDRLGRHGFTVGALLVALAGCTREAAAPEAAAHAESKAAGEAKGKSLVHVDAAARERLGLVVKDLEPRSLRPLAQAYGRVVADPAQTFELRAPVAGSIRSATEWPTLAKTLPDGAEIGVLVPRLSAVERADLAARLAAARGEEATARAALDVATAASTRAQALNADGKNASDRAVEEARGRVQEETARLAAAGEASRVLEGALDPNASTAAALPLVLARGGEVTEIGAHRDESVEAGALILRVARFEETLVRVELPIGASVRPGGRATVVLASRPEVSLDAQPAGAAATSDTQGEALLLRIAGGESARPGAAATAWIERDLPAIDGVVVPRSAVVRHAGKAWIYVASGEDAFAREEIALVHAIPEGWLAAEPAAKGAHTVVVGAQNLLSIELLGAGGGGGEE